jgi:hypothetical protein
MEETNLPKKFPLKNRIIGFFIALMILIGSSVFVLEKIFSDFEPTDPMDNPVKQESQEASYTGTIKYISPEMNIGENISYELIDNNKEPIILLKSKDDKLKVAENLDVTVKGTKTKTAQGEELLIVTEIIISN